MEQVTKSRLVRQIMRHTTYLTDWAVRSVTCQLIGQVIITAVVTRTTYLTVSSAATTSHRASRLDSAPSWWTEPKHLLQTTMTSPLAWERGNYRSSATYINASCCRSTCESHLSLCLPEDTDIFSTIKSIDVINVYYVFYSGHVVYVFNALKNYVFLFKKRC